MCCWISCAPACIRSLFMRQSIWFNAILIAVSLVFYFFLCLSSLIRYTFHFLMFVFLRRRFRPPIPSHLIHIYLTLGIRVANAFSLAYGIHIYMYEKMHTTTERCIRCWHIVSVGAYCMAWCIWYVCALCVCNFIPFVRCRSLNAVKMTIWIPLLFNFIISYSRGARVHQYVYITHQKQWQY